MCVTRGVEATTSAWPIALPPASLKTLEMNWFLLNAFSRAVNVFVYPPNLDLLELPERRTFFKTSPRDNIDNISVTLRKCCWILLDMNLFCGVTCNRD